MDKRSQRSEKTRQNIIQAAMECYQDFGVQGASLEAVAKCAGTSKPTIYAHYGSKEKLYQNVVEHILHQEQETQKLPPFDPTRSIKSQLFDIFDQQLDFVLSCERRRLLVAITIEAMCHGSCHLNDLEQIKTCPMEHWLSDAMAHNTLPQQNARELATNLLALVKGRTFYPTFLGMNDDNVEQRRANLHSALDFFLQTQQAQ
ncbi:TetR/AcrR family transcriptional regulator [Vibrio cholerae]